MDSTLEQSPVVTVMPLTWQRHDGNLVVTPSDHDRLMVKIGRAIEILRLHQRGEQFSGQFTLLLKRLAGWLEGHAGRWDRAFLTAGDSVLRFIVVRKQVIVDEEITDGLSDLGVEIANDPDFDLIKLSTRALPLASNEALQSFLDCSFTIEFNGDGTRAHRVGEQKTMMLYARFSTPTTTTRSRSQPLRSTRRCRS